MSDIEGWRPGTVSGLAYCDIRSEGGEARWREVEAMEAEIVTVLGRYGFEVDRWSGYGTEISSDDGMYNEYDPAGPKMVSTAPPPPPPPIEVPAGFTCFVARRPRWQGEALSRSHPWGTIRLWERRGFESLREVLLLEAPVADALGIVTPDVHVCDRVHLLRADAESFKGDKNWLVPSQDGRIEGREIAVDKARLVEIPTPPEPAAIVLGAHKPNAIRRGTLRPTRKPEGQGAAIRSADPWSVVLGLKTDVADEVLLIAEAVADVLDLPRWVIITAEGVRLLRLSAWVNANSPEALSEEGRCWGRRGDRLFVFAENGPDVDPEDVSAAEEEL